MATANFTATDDVVLNCPKKLVERHIMCAVQTLYDLWTILDSALDHGAEATATACSLARELLPVIGGKLDTLYSSSTGCFEEILSREGITIAAPREANDE
jgi:hypothetical protein